MFGRKVNQSWLVSQPTVAGLRSTASPSVTRGSSTPFASYLTGLLAIVVLLFRGTCSSWTSVNFTSPVEGSVSVSCKYSFWTSRLDVISILLEGDMAGARGGFLICTAGQMWLQPFCVACAAFPAQSRMGYSKEGSRLFGIFGGRAVCRMWNAEIASSPLRCVITLDVVLGFDPSSLEVTATSYLINFLLVRRLCFIVRRSLRQKALVLLRCLDSAQLDSSVSCAILPPLEPAKSPRYHHDTSSRTNDGKWMRTPSGHELKPHDLHWVLGR
jgi:hypothetical protein